MAAKLSYHIDTDPVGIGYMHVGKNNASRMRAACQGRSYDLTLLPGQQLSRIDLSAFDSFLVMDRGHCDRIDRLCLR